MVQEELEAGNLYPELTKIRSISVVIATRVMEEAFAEGLATIPRPDDIQKFVESAMWYPTYENIIRSNL